MHVFKDRKIEFELLPENREFQFEVIKCESSIANKGKTNGCDVRELTLLVDGRVEVSDRFTIPYHEDGTPALTDEKLSEFLNARIDQFLKATGAVTRIGDTFDTRDNASYIGLRGYLMIKHEEYEARGQKLKSNKVGIYVTNKPKLPRNVPATTSANTDPDWE